MVAVRYLLEDLERGLYAIPESQRKFKWSKYKIRDLAESLFNGYPIGTITVWRMPEEFKKEYSYIFRPIIDELKDQTEKNAEYLVIDGLQRLTSLLLLKRNKVDINGESESINLYINPWTLDLKSGKGLDSEPKFFKVKDIINPKKTITEIIREKEQKVDPVKLGDKVMLERILDELRSKFLNADVNIYQIRIDAKDYLELFDKITRIFVLLNSKGTKVTFSDMLLALLTGKIRKELRDSAVKRFKAILDMLGDNWRISESIIARCFMANFTGVIDINVAFRKMDTTTAAQILEILEDLRDELKKTIKFLEMRLGIKKLEFLKSQNLIVLLEYLIHIKYKHMDIYDIPDDDVRKIAKWLIITSFQERYIGRLSEYFNRDLPSIRENGIDGLLSNLQLDHILREWIAGDYTKAHLTLLSILLALNGAKDWSMRGGSSKSISIKNLKADEIHIHHIFPKKHINPDLYDDIGNITLISSKANQKIGEKHPKKYLNNIDKLTLIKHCIPQDKNLWENPVKFIEERRKLLYEEICRLLG